MSRDGVLGAWEGRRIDYEDPPALRFGTASEDEEEKEDEDEPKGCRLVRR